MAAQRENHRLKEFRNAIKKSQAELSTELNLAQGSYSDIERGKSNITYSQLKFLVNAYRLNPLWMMSGKGELFLPDEAEHTSKELNEQLLARVKVLEYDVAELKRKG